MTQRERTLAIIVGALLLVAAGMFTWDWVTGAFRQRRNILSSLEDQVEDKKLTQREGERADERIRGYEARSLPSDIEDSRSLYQEWLLTQITDLGFSDPNVQAIPPRSTRDIYTQLAFRVNGTGDLEQVTQFLHRFYSVNHLHRVFQLTLQPVSDSKDMTLDAQVQALVLPGAATGEALSTDPSERLAMNELSAYTETIAARNVFGPGNEPPRLSRIGQREAIVGKDFRFRVRADDPDDSGPLLYQLLDGAPEGATIDERSGEFRWTPDDLGEFEAKIQVTDAGIPAETVTQTLTIRVVEPREEPADTGDAEFTFVTAVTEGQQRLVWLLHRTSGRRFKLEEGDEFEAGQLRGKVGKIGIRYAQLVLGDRTLQVSVGQNLDEGRELPDESL